MPHGKLNYGDDNIINKVKQFRDEILDNNLKLRKKMYIVLVKMYRK